jgi:uncharacterized coiled-coil DUF342 family protein
MDRQQLQEDLDQLAKAIDGLQAPSDDKKQLVGLIEEIEQQLAAPLIESQTQSLADQVDTMVSTFETDHPTVAAILNNIMVTLTSMGV